MLDIAYRRCRDADEDEMKHMYVITVINNPEGWQRRGGLMREFRRHMEEDLKTRLIIVECAYGDQAHVATEAGNPMHVQVRCNSELWIKEALINRGIAALPLDAKYVAWIDADVFFVRRDVMVETVHALQTHSIVQMFRHCNDMGPDGEMMHLHESFGFGLTRGKTANSQLYNHSTMHTGYAWAARVDALEKVGGLFDVAILGSGDHIMAHAVAGSPLEIFVQQGMHPNYVKVVAEYQRRCEVHMHRDMGFVDGTILHGYHGDKVMRQYNTRSRILVDNHFDPTTDIRKNRHGVYELVTDVPHRLADIVRLRDDIREYNRSRHEDATTRVFKSV